MSCDVPVGYNQFLISDLLLYYHLIFVASRMTSNSRGIPSKKQWIISVVVCLLMIQVFVLLYFRRSPPFKHFTGNYLPPVENQTSLRVLSVTQSNLGKPNFKSFQKRTNLSTNSNTSSDTTQISHTHNTFMTSKHTAVSPPSTERANKILGTNDIPVTYTLQPPDIEQLATWKTGTFCDNYIGHALRKPVEMCGGDIKESDTLNCFGSPENDKMAVCSAQYVGVEAKKLQRVVLDCDACNIYGSGSFHLIRNNMTYCNRPNVNTLQSYTEHNDPVYQSMKEITSSAFVPSDTCHLWINKTAYFFHSQRYHIYFRLYSYYNLYKTLLDRKANPGDYIVVRMAEATVYKFAEFERSLFPDLVTLSKFPDQRVCFREVVFVPWTYACVMFRCKMDGNTKQKCLQCNGKDLLGTSLMTFRTRALQACSLEDQTPQQRKSRKTKSIVFVKRKPYNRWEGDALHNFQRVLSNQDSFIRELKIHFENVSVHDVFMEDMDICEQMQLVHECDVFVGVHGAGLVHAWWLHDDAAVLELAPSSQVGNPSFKTLTMVTGRRYHSLSISGSVYQVSVDIERTISMIESIADFD